MPVDYDVARQSLDDAFDRAERSLLAGQSAPSVVGDLAAHCELLFSSSTQAYREVLVGCVLARLQDRSIDIRKPYINLGEGAFNGRTLDERVVNPFLHDRHIPSSRGPYLSVFRRSVSLVERTRGGVRDKGGFDALLKCVTFIETCHEDDELSQLLAHLMYRFAELRESANVPLVRIQRFSLPQYSNLIHRLLNSASGGRFPVFLVIATLRAVSNRYGLGWNIAFQGINVADAPSGAGGDVTVTLGDELLLTAEITERAVDRSRIVSTFATKIAPSAIKDYLFLVSERPGTDAREQCHQYFAQGHEINFVEIAAWIESLLATIGVEGRLAFNTELIGLLDEADTPKSVKMAWNACVSDVLGSPA